MAFSVTNPLRITETMLEECLGLIPSVEDHGQTDRRTLADKGRFIRCVGPVSPVRLKVRSSNACLAVISPSVSGPLLENYLSIAIADRFIGKAHEARAETTPPCRRFGQETSEPVPELTPEESDSRSGTNGGHALIPFSSLNSSQRSAMASSCRKK